MASLDQSLNARLVGAIVDATGTPLLAPRIAAVCGKEPMVVVGNSGSFEIRALGSARTG